MQPKKDVYDLRDELANARAYFHARPDIVAVYTIMVAFNRHRHEGKLLSEVREIYDAESKKLGRLLKQELRQKTEKLLNQKAISEDEYNSLIAQWAALRGYLEDGRLLFPRIAAVLFLIIALTVVAMVVIKLVHFGTR